MPKSTQLTDPSVALDGAAPAKSADTIRAKADALFRTACECCRQHQRYARLVALPGLEIEQRTARDIARLWDETLEAMTAAYEKCTQRAHPNGDDEAWWQRANALWHASREYIRRHALCEKESRRVEERSSARLGELQLDYELEASALLAMQQAIEAYKKVRPSAAV
jgi:hypothetical protein